jgi:type II secretory pathway component GspD/PulD (secretin)
MKRYLLLFFSLFSLPVFAGYDVNFNDVPVGTISKAVSSLVGKDINIRADKRITWVASYRDVDSLILGFSVVLAEHGLERESVRVLSAQSPTSESTSHNSRYVSDVPRPDQSIPELPMSELPLSSEPVKKIVRYIPVVRSYDVVLSVLTGRGCTVDRISAMGGIVAVCEGEEQFEGLVDFDLEVLTGRVRVTVIERTLNNDTERGIHGIFDIVSNFKFSAMGSISGAGIIFKGDTSNALIKHILSSGNSVVISQADLSITSGGSVDLSSGSDVPVRSSITYSDVSELSRQSIEYKQAGLKITVKGDIFENQFRGDFRLDRSSVSVNNTSGIDSPIINKSSLHSSINVPNNSLMLIGGLIQSTNQESKSHFLFFPLSSVRSASMSMRDVVLEFYRE